MILTAVFETPGRTIKITVKKLSDLSVVVNNLTMQDIGNGLYKYDFTAIDTSIQYMYVCVDQNSLEDAVDTIDAQPNISISEQVIHDALDSYPNKDDYKGSGSSGSLSTAQNAKLMSLENTNLKQAERLIKSLLSTTTKFKRK